MLEFLRRNRVLLSSGVFLCSSRSCCWSSTAVGARRIDPLGRVFSRCMAPLQRVDHAGRRRAFGGVWRTLREPRRRASSENARASRAAPSISSSQHQHDTEVELENERLASAARVSRPTLPAQVGDGAGHRQGRARDLFRRFVTRPGRARRRRSRAWRSCAPTASSARSSRRARTRSRVLLLSRSQQRRRRARAAHPRARHRRGHRSTAGCRLKYVKRGDDVASRRRRRDLRARRRSFPRDLLDRPCERRHAQGQRPLPGARTCVPAVDFVEARGSARADVAAASRMKGSTRWRERARRRRRSRRPRLRPLRSLRLRRRATGRPRPHAPRPTRDALRHETPRSGDDRHDRRGPARDHGRAPSAARAHHARPRGHPLRLPWRCTSTASPAPLGAFLLGYFARHLLGRRRSDCTPSR